MTTIEIIQIVLFFGLGIALTPPVGKFMYKVFTGQKTFLHPIFRPIENFIYKLSGVDPQEEMSWLKYFWAVLLFATVGFVADMAIFMTQQWLPMNPQHLPTVPGTWPSCRPGVSPATRIGSLTPAKRP